MVAFPPTLILRTLNMMRLSNGVVVKVLVTKCIFHIRMMSNMIAMPSIGVVIGARAGTRRTIGGRVRTI